MPGGRITYGGKDWHWTGVPGLWWGGVEQDAAETVGCDDIHLLNS